MIKRTNTYETLFLVNPLLEDPQIDAIITKVKDLILKNGGNILALDLWGRKRLAYNIKNKNTGYYALVEFSAPAESISFIERFFNLEEEIYRHIIIKLDEKALKSRISSTTQSDSKVDESVEIEK